MTAHSGHGDEPREGVVLPSNSEPWPPRTEEHAQSAPPTGGQPWGQPWGPSAAVPPPPPAHLPPAPAGPPPPAPGAGAADETQLMPPHPGVQPAPPHQGVPGPADATQVLPPLPSGGAPSYGGPPPPHHGAPGPADETQLLPPQPSYGGSPPPHRGVPGPADETQLLPPQGVPAPGADAASSAAAQGGPESTQQLRRVPAQQRAGRHRAQPPAQQSAQPPAQQPPPGKPFGIRPGAPEDRQPPAEFDSLFRPADGTAAVAPERPAAPGRAGYGYPQPRSGYGYPQQAGGPHPGHAQPPGGPAGPGGPGPGGPQGPEEPYGTEGRRRNPLLVVAAAALVIVAAGLAVGVALSGGDEEPVEEPGRSAAPSAEPEEPAGDTAAEQARALDALLADSNNSRDAVISSVENIKECTKLGKAAEDLRDAAGQRNDLVDRLDELDLDRLPDHEALTEQLTAAWKASAEADDHYAQWADDVAGSGGCPGGEARTTEALGAGNRSSGEATAAKKEAAALWNPIAREHGLSERQPTQL
ncbi:hypothetical protein GCM10023347_48770 [Streptomyces chumphonensis]|uniref:Uncharacterized protein n=1 Tax=Streptomyces chumphonensis TaxID=1214925 RepID=A0A927IBL0_9ACTN|nr:hypothetical protein [Streptomyces chumphonensis]MBD3933043.1 hypothetical protein [Streptomyces chumphonensis]